MHFRTKIVAPLLSALVSLFIIVIAVALLRGTTGDCGCFGPLGSEKLGLGLIVRDTLILIGCLLLSFQKELNPSERNTIDYS